MPWITVMNIWNNVHHLNQNVNTDPNQNVNPGLILNPRILNVSPSPRLTVRVLELIPRVVKPNPGVGANPTLIKADQNLRANHLGLIRVA